MLVSNKMSAPDSCVFSASAARCGSWRLRSSRSRSRSSRFSRSSRAFCAEDWEKREEREREERKRQEAQRAAEKVQQLAAGSALCLPSDVDHLHDVFI